MNHNHQDVTCPHCAAAKNKTGANKAFGEKLRAFLGICGCLSCYIAMFPAILLSVIGVFGLSQSATSSALNAYLGSALFQPILIISVLLLVVGLLRYGKIPLALSILAGVGIFASMNFYMQGWLFTLSFGVLALAYYLALQKTKAQPLKIALTLLLIVVAVGVIDLARLTLSTKAPAQNNSMDMMQ